VIELGDIARYPNEAAARAVYDDLKPGLFEVRPEGAFDQWREVPPRELSIDLVADERFGRATGRIEAS